MLALGLNKKHLGYEEVLLCFLQGVGEREPAFMFPSLKEKVSLREQPGVPWL